MKKLRSVLFRLCLVGLFSVTVCNRAFCEEIDSDESAEQSNTISIFGIVAEPAESIVNHPQEDEESLENDCEIVGKDITVLYKELEDTMETLSNIENHRYENYKIQKLLEEQAASSVYLNGSIQQEAIYQELKLCREKDEAYAQDLFIAGNDVAEKRNKLNSTLRQLQEQQDAENRALRTKRRTGKSEEAVRLQKEIDIMKEENKKLRDLTNELASMSALTAM